MVKIRFAVFIVALLTPLMSQGQLGAGDNSAESEANQAYATHHWPQAETSYSLLKDQHPGNARFWYRLGVSARADKHYELALESFAQAKTLGASKGLPNFEVDYEISSTYAAKGNATGAFASLKTAADEGFLQSDRLEHDPEWSDLRADRRFSALLKQVRHNAAPCDDPQFREFDFWLGDWDVTAASGGLAQGTSQVSKEMGNCVI